MKAVYHTEIYFSFILKNKKQEREQEYNTHYKTFSSLNYGELPETKIKEFNNPDTVFRDLLNALGYTDTYLGERTLFTKRQYVNEYEFDRYIYKDELISFKVIFKYIPHEYCSALDLQRKLTFEDYTQLVFDREQELKSTLPYNKEDKQW